MPTEHNSWYGTAELSPSEPVVAGTYGTWRLTYTVGRYGIDNTGSILVCWKFASDWGRPQTTDPAGENYLTAATTGEATLRASYIFKGFTRPWYHVVWVDVYDGDLAPGDDLLTFHN